MTRPKPPLGQITIGTESRNLGCSFAKSCWNNECTENVADIVFFIVYKVYFLLVLSKRSIQSECEYTEKGITSAMECADVAGFTFVT